MGQFVLGALIFAIGGLFGAAINSSSSKDKE
jgi:hypothetical protein